MTALLLIIAGVLFLYWLFGSAQPVTNKPQVFRGGTGGLWILMLAIAIAFAALLL